jgi:hypothetical protein
MARNFFVSEEAFVLIDLEVILVQPYQDFVEKVSSASHACQCAPGGHLCRLKCWEHGKEHLQRVIENWPGS